MISYLAPAESETEYFIVLCVKGFFFFFHNNSWFYSINSQISVRANSLYMVYIEKVDTSSYKLYS